MQSRSLFLEELGLAWRVAGHPCSPSLPDLLKGPVHAPDDGQRYQPVSHGGISGAAFPVPLSQAQVAGGGHCPERGGQCPVFLTKVRAHIGVHGNSLTDSPDSQAHDRMDAVLTGFCDPSDRGPAWPQCISHGQIQNLNDIKKHALRVTATAYAESMDSRKQHLKSTSFFRVHDAMAHHSGWHDPLQPSGTQVGWLIICEAWLFK